ncbi:RHS Repeat protein [Metarhizium acridum CQMa 102]|uniref:RHS Repeat protein n=1 Tax=Metarhizium acridum (strain CQMa 102) TaxID=655827 RepID=E9EAL7_METAQ|nr:RHS Repeat protein [Metarhizium acridum CQMa 102]EFY87017.1 RHS Repeat protein [Metarhizium acridum CQMa 102]
MDYNVRGRRAPLSQCKVPLSLAESRVQDEANKTTTTTKLTCDDFGRETIPSIYKDSTTLLQHLTQSYKEIDLVSSRKKENDQGILREESFQYDIHNHLVSYDCTGSQPPTDYQGRSLRWQHFRFGKHDNITQCSTLFQDGSTNTAVYSSSEQDPTQLVNMRNTDTSDPAK